MLNANQDHLTRLRTTLEGLTDADLNNLIKDAYTGLKRVGLLPSNGSNWPGEEWNGLNVGKASVPPGMADELPSEAIMRLLSGERGSKYWQEGRDPGDREDVLWVLRRTIWGLIGNIYEKLRPKPKKRNKAEEAPMNQNHPFAQEMTGLPDSEAAAQNTINPKDLDFDPHQFYGQASIEPLQSPEELDKVIEDFKASTNLETRELKIVELTIHGADRNQIAEELGVSISTVRRALVKLQAWLEEAVNEPDPNRRIQ